MKKSFIFVASALVIALASCTEVLPEKEALNSGKNKIVFGMAPETVTKTALLDASGNADPDGVTPYWQTGDKIKILGDHPEEVIEVIETEMNNKKEYAAETDFSGDDPFYGAYPAFTSGNFNYADHITLVGSTIRMTIPNEQTGLFKDAHFCAAKSYYTTQPGYSRTYHLDFYPVAPILHFKKSDFEGYNLGYYLEITGYFTETIYLQDDLDGYMDDRNAQIVGDISVDFKDNSEPIVDKIEYKGDKKTEDSRKVVRVFIDEDTPNDIYVALWPGVRTSDIIFKYGYGQSGTSSYYASFPVQNVTLECNKIYPSFFGRRVSTISILNNFLANNKVTNGNAHFLIINSELYEGAEGTVLFNSNNIGKKIGIDFPVDTEHGKSVSFALADGVAMGPTDLFLVVPKGKNITLNFSKELMDNTSIKVNKSDVHKSTCVVK